MKKIVLGMIAVTLALSAMAQTNENSTDKNKRDHKEYRSKQFKDLESFKKLNLSDAQTAQIRTINESFRQQMEDLRKQGNITVDEQKQKRKDLMADRKQKIEAVLTAEQRKNAEAFARDFKGGRDGRDDKFTNLTKDLNLTPEQSQKMTTINNAFKTDLERVRNNASLSTEEKSRQIRNLMKQHRSDMETLLTDDQKQQLKNRQKNRSNRATVK